MKRVIDANRRYLGNNGPGEGLNSRSMGAFLEQMPLPEGSDGALDRRPPDLIPAPGDRKNTRKKQNSSKQRATERLAVCLHLSQAKLRKKNLGGLGRLFLDFFLVVFFPPSRCVESCARRERGEAEVS
ncbi:hypothetical protein B296_00038105 [Ensete ventricosum]|uniref:Uncharacterized protein n=1 Tax=Ensete ventricosum TaxID=4639 RepID=A0A426ZXI0_ENSVE|nr:hypothetical protein B296_00038105 [Ensete ventricosum]